MIALLNWHSKIVQHLVFVNTRRLAERVAHHLAERLGEDQVAAHHGSLSRKLRLAAETNLKNGELKVLVATASLELGIDIGTIDLFVKLVHLAPLPLLCNVSDAQGTGMVRFQKDAFLPPRAMNYWNVLH